MGEQSGITNSQITISEKKYSLEKLLKGVSENNLHGEFDTGAPIGKEIW